MGKATGWGDFQKKWHLEHPKEQTVHQIFRYQDANKTNVGPFLLNYALAIACMIFQGVGLKDLKWAIVKF